MQLALDNPGGELMPGGYANVRMSLQRDTVPLHIPASALIFNQSGLRVATVGADDKVLFKTVTIARDLGRDIELASGIAADDRVIVAPPDGIADGDQVRVAGAKSQAGQGFGKAGRQGVGESLSFVMPGLAGHPRLSVCNGQDVAASITCEGYRQTYRHPESIGFPGSA